jgi:uncharacterized lipoprotein YmbA
MLMALLLSACGSSPPSRFYTLDPVPPSRPMATSAGPAIEVSQVSLPESLDRLSFVTRIEPNRINVSDQDRWAAPLEGMVRRVLATNLASRLPGRTVRMPGDPPSKGRSLKIIVNIRQFIGDQTGHVVLDADWAATMNDRTTLSGRPETISVQATSPKAGSITTAMSQALGTLSDRIAAAIVAHGRA